MGNTVDLESIPDLPSYSLPESQVALRLSTTMHPEAIKWLVGRIARERQDGGAQLLVQCQPFHRWKDESFVLHITATTEVFLEYAELLKLKKEDSTGNLREFEVADLNSFLQKGIEKETLLSLAERQMIIVYGLHSMLTLEDEEFVPGYVDFSLVPGECVLQLLFRTELIESFFPLHDPNVLQYFSNDWYLNYQVWKPQPVDEIRNYFGDQITFYYIAMAAYTDSLLIPTAFSLLVWILGKIFGSIGAYALLILSIFNVIWITICLELWKRRSSTLAFEWGTFEMEEIEESRYQFYGTEMERDRVSGNLVRTYPAWKRYVKICASWFALCLCVNCAISVMLYTIHKKETMEPGFRSSLISFVYGYAIRFMDTAFKKFAIILTEWENHRTETKNEFHRILKLVCFEFINNFISLFYISFYLHDFNMVADQIRMLQLEHMFTQIAFPFIRNKKEIIKGTWAWAWTKWFKSPEEPKEVAEIWSYWPLKRLGLLELSSHDPRSRKFETEVILEKYQSTFDDYLELWVQFGYVFLFSAITPMAIFWALTSNIVEIRTDAYKLCNWFQRPFARRAESIGAWQAAFETLGIIAVMTNCVLLSLSPNLRAHAPSFLDGDWTWTIFFVILGLILVSLELYLKWHISDVPPEIKLKFAVQEEAKALRKSNTKREMLKQSHQDWLQEQKSANLNSETERNTNFSDGNAADANNTQTSVVPTPEGPNN